MLLFKNKNNYIGYFIILFLIIAIILSIKNLLTLHEYIGGERPSALIINNYDYSGTVNDTQRDIETDNQFYLKKTNNNSNIEKFFNLKRNKITINNP